MEIGILSISPHITSLFFSLFITIPTGFLLSKYIVFQAVANNKIQIIKYIFIVVLSLTVNYILMKLFVEKIHLTPFISKICTTAIIVIFSYISQKKFAFKS
jgi:putative flippase GtrA